MTFARRAIAAIAGLAIGLSANFTSAAEIAPQRPGVVDVYFVGFAAWGAQDVFLSEARGAASVVASAYKSPDRALLLSNERGSGLPAATPKALSEALATVAKTMDTREDVLFLLVTSHGSPQGVALERHGAVFGVLSPAKLRSMLDASGIRNAVVVVSACYSGVYRALGTHDRLVIMAARPDRPSFGCKDGERWTYFGEAFFPAALARDPDPRRAFAAAKTIVTKRELTDGFPPSEPQIAGGRRVAARLSGAR
jgi:hypothetical protein